jgi:Cytidylate kinase-like family
MRKGGLRRQLFIHLPKGIKRIPIIIISSGGYHRGSEVAKRAAAELGYECISREVLLEASKLFDIAELKLMRAIHDAPSLQDRFGHDKKKYVAFIRTALLRKVQKDNVVYHGFAAHFFLQGIPQHPGCLHFK